MRARRLRPGRGMTEAPGWGRRLFADGGCNSPPRNGEPSGMVEFGLRLLKGPWATAALLCLAALVVLFALAGQTLNAPFVYTAPR